jgi:hypothetical protein
MARDAIAMTAIAPSMRQTTSIAAKATDLIQIGRAISG